MRNDQEKRARRPARRARDVLAPHHAERLAERRRRQDALLDEALMETFPASDPISVMQIT